MIDYNAAQMQMEAHSNFKEDQSSKVVLTNYRSLIGNLKYFTHTWPTLIYIMGSLTRYMEKQTSNHLLEEKILLRYLKGMLNYGLVYEKDRNLPN